MSLAAHEVIAIKRLYLTGAEIETIEHAFRIDTSTAKSIVAETLDDIEYLKDSLDTFTAKAKKKHRCPLTNRIFVDPVRASDGQLYERHAILRYLHKSQNSPVTGEPMEYLDLATLLYEPRQTEKFCFEAMRTLEQCIEKEIEEEICVKFLVECLTAVTQNYSSDIYRRCLSKVRLNYFHWIYTISMEVRPNLVRKIIYYWVPFKDNHRAPLRLLDYIEEEDLRNITLEKNALEFLEACQLLWNQNMLAEEALGEDHEFQDACKHLLIGKLALVVQNINEAQNSLERIKRRAFQHLLASKHYELSEFHRCLGNLYLQVDRFEDAQIHLEEALKVRMLEFGEDHPETAIIHQDLGRLFMKFDDLDEAEEHYEKCVKIRVDNFDKNHPDLGSAYFDLGNLYFKQERFDDAMRTLNQSLEIYDTNRDIWIFKLGDIIKVIEEINQLDG